MKAHFKFLSGARVGQIEEFRKAYIGLGRHPLSDVRFDAERDLEVSSRHAAIVRQAEGFVLRDLESKNGTYVNGQRISGDVLLKEGDVLGFGLKGPSVEFRIVEATQAEAASAGSGTLAERMSAPRQVYEAVPSGAAAAPARSSTAVRIAIEVRRQTHELRRTTKILFAALLLTAGAFAWLQWNDRARARALVLLQTRADSLAREAQQLLSQFQSELQVLRDALGQSQAEVARLGRELAAARGGGDDATVARLRAELDAAEERQRHIIGARGVDYRGISKKNTDAVALVLVEFAPGESYSGTAFAVDSQGTLVTNKHVLVGEAGDRRPQRIAVKFSGSNQWFEGRYLGVSDAADIGVVKVSIRGGTPRVVGIARDPRSLQRGDPVAIIGYPLGEDLPMERQGKSAVADPTLTVGTVSKVLTNIIQVDGFGAPGSSGSPIFDRDGRVVAVLYGGEREAQGKIIFAVPAQFAVNYLVSLGLAK